MEEYEIQILKTVILILIFIVISKLAQRIITKVGIKYSYLKTRIKIVKKIIRLVLILIFIGIILMIWGIDPPELGGYIASLLTVIGIAFLAQWSILSNITSTLIIFFNHQVNIGDSIVILDKDFHVEGEISDIGIFFIIIKVNPEEYVSLPSNIFMQKMIKKIKQ